MRGYAHLLSLVIPLWIVSLFCNCITGEYLVWSFIGVLVPDRLEPANNYKHRSFFHSKRMLKKLVLVMLICFGIGFFAHWLWYVSSFALGYIVHLLGDATTPMGLPK